MKKHRSSHFFRKGRPGFALVVTLTLMILLALLAVSFLSLSSIAARHPGNAIATARANARMALILAIGELQKQAGSDQRVTAEAAILENPDEPTEHIPHRHWTGIWRTDRLKEETATPTEKPALLYHKTGTTGFDIGTLVDRRMRNGEPAEPEYNPETQVLNWLVSNPNPGTLLDPGTSPDDHFVSLVGEGSSDPSTAGTVSAPIVPVTQQGTRTGGFAWWVSDQGTKATANLARPANQNYEAMVPSRFGLGVMDDFAFFDDLPDSESPKIITMNTLDHVGTGNHKEARKQRFHDLTSQSYGVIADPLRGGLKRDLTAILATGTATALGPTRPAISSSTSLFYDIPSLKEIGPRFGLLKSWNDLATDNSNGEIAPRAGNTAIGQTRNIHRDLSGSGGTSSWRIDEGSGIKLIDQSKIAVHPVVVEATVTYGTSLFLEQTNVTPSGKNEYRVRVHYCPRVVLWNPYNVKLSAATYAVQISMPLYYTLTFNTTNDSGQTTPTNIPLLNGLGGTYSQQHYYTNGQSNLPHRPIFLIQNVSLEPGEAVLFTAPIRDIPWGAHDSPDSKNPDRFSLAANPNNNLWEGSFYFETDGRVRYSAQEINSGSATYTWAVYNGNTNYSHLHIWSKFWLVDDTPLFIRQIENNLSVAKPLSYHHHTDDGGTPGFTPYYNMGAGASFGNPVYETGAQGPGGAQFTPLSKRKWGNRLIWMNETTENTNVAEAGYNPAFLDYNQFANHNPRATWHIRSACEVHLRAAISGQAAGRSAWGNMIDDAYAWDWKYNQTLQPVLTNGKNRVSPFNAPGEGVAVYPFFQIPSPATPLLSLGMLQHCPLSPFPWHPGWAVGNSFADARVPRNKSTNYVPEGIYDNQPPYYWNYLGGAPGANFRQFMVRGLNYPAGAASGSIYDYSPHFTANAPLAEQNWLYDLSFEANQALWDRFFFSSVPRTGALGTGNLPNPRIQPISDLSSSAAADARNANKAASQLIISGAFNVNSTSEQAWRTVLSSFRANPDIELSLADGTTKISAENVFSRLTRPLAGEFTGNDILGENATWAGYRKLTDAQIAALAREIVAEVKRRGPFISLSDFINRRLVALPTAKNAETDITKTGLKGALQAAIDRTNINEPIVGTSASPIQPISHNEYNHSSTAAGQRVYGNDYPKITYGDPRGPFYSLGAKPDHHHWAESKLTGSPAFVTQADVLQKIGPVLSARGDTFLIRAYGEARNASGTVTAKAYAEAIVQRTVTPITPDPATDNIDPIRPTGNGVDWGRRFNLVSFKWLHPSEI